MDTKAENEAGNENESPVVNEDEDNKITQEDNEIVIGKQEIRPLPAAAQEGGAVVGNAPILQEMNNLQEPEKQVDTEVFEEIPEAYCGQLYSTVLEAGWSLKNKGFPLRELPEKRVQDQGHIIYEIMKKNQISFAHIDLFMLGAGMIADWKYMDSYKAEQDRDEKTARSEA